MEATQTSIPTLLVNEAHADQNVEERNDRERSSELPVALTREHVVERLSILGRNPFTQTHVYTTANLTGLYLSDIDVIKQFPHIQHLICNQNALKSLSPLQHIPLLLTLDVTNNLLTSVLDFAVPKCSHDQAWTDGAYWSGSILRKAFLDSNRIISMPHYELATTHPFLLELRLAHNAIEEISGVSQLRFLRLLDLSHNHITSSCGLVCDKGQGSPYGLRALETLLLSHNRLKAIDSRLALFPRLTYLDISHNQLHTLSSLKQLELAHNNVEDINELNNLANLQYLRQMSLYGCPLVETQVSHVLYRARVLRRLLQLEKLDSEQVTSKEKVKALAMHGNDLEARRQVAAKYVPGQEFTDYLPPLDFEDDNLDLSLR